MKSEIKLPVAELKEALPGLKKVIGSRCSNSCFCFRERPGILVLECCG